MAVSEGLVKELESTQKFFKTTLSVFATEDEGFALAPELYSVAGHVAHAADSIDWFIEGAFGDGWDLDFDALIAKAKAVTSLAVVSGIVDHTAHHRGSLAVYARLIGKEPLMPYS
jgi:hypothetical protein